MQLITDRESPQTLELEACRQNQRKYNIDQDWQVLLQPFPNVPNGFPDGINEEVL